jgi:hypothetical protein
MDARTKIRCGVVFGLLGAVVLLPAGMSARATAADAQTQNFIIMDAPTTAFAGQVGREAERYRRELAQHWLGKELPPWPSRCVLRVVAGNIPAQGVTTYRPYPGYVGDFQMEVVGTEQRILDSVLPHEITHTVLATHFGRPLPRWADEGISTTVEHIAEKSKHETKLREFLGTRRGIPMNVMFQMTEYPKEMLTLYAQGYSVCRFLIEQRGPQEFVRFLETFMARRSWTQAVQVHYEYESLKELQDYWLAWVADGSKDVTQFAKASSKNLANSQLVARSDAALNGGSLNGGSLKGGALASGQNPIAGQSGITLASSSQSTSDLPTADGWYALNRDSKATQSPLAADPPSISGATASNSPATHSSAQPQPEQGSVTTVPAGPSSPWTPQPARLWR